MTATPTVTVTPTFGPGCAAGPIAGCRAPAVVQKALLQIKDKTPDDKDKLLWKWLKGSVTAKADFGTPTTTTNYQFCIYDSAGLILDASIPAGQFCNGVPCWQEKPTSFKYKDKLLTPDGVLQLQLKEGLTAGKAKILLKAKGVLLDDPVIPISQPVTVQLSNSNGQCWEAVYSARFASSLILFSF